MKDRCIVWCNQGLCKRTASVNDWSIWSNLKRLKEWQIYLTAVSAVLMLSPIWSIAERFGTTWIFTSVGFFTCVRSEMGLEVFQSWVRLYASFELKFSTVSVFSLQEKDIYRAFVGFFAGMTTHMNHEHILGFEWLFGSWALIPSTHKGLFI